MNSNLSVASASSLPATSNRRDLSCTETAKILRQSLKEAFPGIKFSVRSSKYSGGACIDVNWEDGPSEAQVDPIVDRFRGAYFDGMEDYKGSRFAMMTTGAGLEQVSFGADFVKLSRYHSDQALQRAIGAVFRRYRTNFREASIEMPAVREYRDGSLYNVRLRGVHGQHGGDSLQDSIRLAAGKHTFVLKVEKSKTAASIFVTHTDGRPHAPPVLND
ncbi:MULTISPECIES: LPD29 domain-containing protein [Pandoraea]|uniref:Large polyvalent protein associated domain-containing protein n=2 Tax=Pandoraea TaxID=93217 RepID=A0A5E4XDF5_9BURK|nr:MULTISPECIES: LPD29 domain-containing protein [Pandoraea]VVE16522.1 hypothetical protein PCE31107_02923 [Pandoraea cepalis]VVE34374.1 hypothetical protein PTE31013_03844 [Pandoraea terrigena]